jgi:hypothetical protein
MKNLQLNPTSKHLDGVFVLKYQGLQWELAQSLLMEQGGPVRPAEPGDS